LLLGVALQPPIPVSGAQTGGKPAIVTVAVFPGAAQNWALYVGQSQGFFRNAGLDVQLTAIPSAPNTMQAVVTGAIDIANDEPFSLFSAVVKNGPIASIIAGDVNIVPTAVVTSKDITSLQQLKGKVIGGTVITAYFLREYLKRAGGLGYDDYKFLASGASGQRLRALGAGQVQAVLLDQPIEFLAHAEGFHTLGYLSDVIQTVGDVLFAGNAWAKANPGTVVAFLKAFHRSVAWLYDPANKQAAVDILVREIDTTPALATQTYDLYVTQLRIFSDDGTIPDQNLQVVSDLMSEQGGLPTPPPRVSRTPG